MTRLCAVPLAVLVVLLAAWPAAAADFTVNTPGDFRGSCPLTCTVRAAVNAANASNDAASTITVPAGTYSLTSGQLTITKQVTIEGAGATATTITGDGTARIFSVGAEHWLTLAGVTVSGGNATTDTANPYGGNVLVTSGGRLFVLASRITGGSAPSGGGGIALRGGLSAALAYSVVDNNTTGGSGGGILAEPPVGSANGGAVTMLDSTVAFNTAASGGGIASLSNASAVSLERVTVADNRSSSVPGGGLYITPTQANFTVKSSIVARNTGNLSALAVVIGPSDCAPTAPVNSGQNVESGSDCGFTNGSQNADAGLAPQLTTVDETFVLPLLAGSPAIDRAVDCGTGTQDQTGTARPVGPACDSGAFEYIPPLPEPTPTATPASQPTVSPTPVPTATTTPSPTPTPAYNKTVVAGKVRGTVLVRAPKASKFNLLPAVQAIRVGSTVDARKGVVTLTSVPKAGGKPETATFFDGMFKVTQAGGITTLTLNEPLAPCASKRKAAGAAAKKPKTRKLWGDGKGKFRTKGQYSAATIRGTKWLVQDGCRYTRTRVAVGVVTVRDDVKKKTIILRKGKTYTARPRR